MLPVGFYAGVDSVVKNTVKNDYSEKAYDSRNMRRSVEGKEAVRQSVIRILGTERFRYPVYSSDYGLDTVDLVGRDRDYVCAELERRISEALTVDDRIVKVTDFVFRVLKGEIHVSFVVHTKFGVLKIERRFGGV
jgi:hypothetical protein